MIDERLEDGETKSREKDIRDQLESKYLPRLFILFIFIGKYKILNQLNLILRKFSWW